ncbi:MAG: hypothetical protein HY695_25235 [Deltaproteobacteria bacterium]|nr:hypothetical protein [Deltaproteobacteria bacterium]
MEVIPAGLTRTEAVSRYIANVRKNAALVNYSICPVDEEVFQLELAIAGDADDGRISGDDAWNKLQAVTARHLIRLYGR